MQGHRRRLPARASLALLGLAVLVFVPGALGMTMGAASNGGLPELQVLSGRADLVSGGSALLQVVLPNRVDPSTVRVSVDGRDVTSSFAVRPNGLYEGVVTGFAIGANDVMASMRNGPTVHLTVTNHPNGGPIFAGAQVQPWLCKTFAGFPVPTNDQCDGEPLVSWQYMDAVSHTFKPYDPSAPPAASQIAMTTTDQGVTVPYVIRSEHGAMDRGLYDTTVLATPGATPAPWSASPWNHKLLYQFGGGTAPWHTNGTPQGDVIDLALSRGFMVANNNLNIRGDNANDVVSAEALLMLKQRIAQTYGAIRYTIGTGCSGGSIQQYVIAADYPGLLDGIQPNCSFQDSWTTADEVTDCHVLRNYFAHTAAFTAAQQAAVEGTQDTTVCLFWDLSFAPVGIPSRIQNCNLQGTPLAGGVYNAATNPTGYRCDVQDYQSAIWGFRPQDGFARSPYANVGIQYGLGALNAGTITPEQFVALNEGVGGVDIDLNFTAARTQPDLVAESIAHSTGQVTQGTQLANVPIIDLRGSHNFNDIHTDYHSYVMRARLDAANGGHGNQLIWTWNGSLFGIGPPPTVALKSFLTMDAWLAKMETDTRDVPLSQKVLDDKPSGASDECFIGAGLTETTDAGACAAAFPYFSDARIVAGSPWTDNAMQCALQPLDRSAYAVTFTDAQWARLQAAFPDGVCDWSAPPVGFGPSTPWLSYAGGPGGQPLGPAPASHPGPAKQ